jgi:hypothetical protein
MNLTQLIAYTRDLTGVYSTDVVSDTLVTRWINEAYREVERKASWPWSPITLLSSGSNIPAFDEQFHQVLAYRAAVKVLGFLSDDTKRNEVYMAEFAQLLQDMLKADLSGLAPGTSGTLAQMVRSVRDLVGVYDRQVVTDAVIKMYINSAYVELSQLHDWDWLEANHSAALPAAVDGVRTVSLSSGTRRVIDAVLVRPSGEIVAMVQVPSLSPIEVNDSGVYYDVNYSGAVRIKCPADTEGTVRIRYTQATATLSSDGSTPAFASQFSMILVYRAAASVLAAITGDDKRISTLMAEYDSLYQSMRSLYELNHDDRPIQIGERGAQERRHKAWFRPA